MPNPNHMPGDPLPKAATLRLKKNLEDTRKSVGFIADLTPGDADDWSIFQHNFTVWLMRNPDVLITGKVKRDDPPPPMPATVFED